MTGQTTIATTDRPQSTPAHTAIPPLRDQGLIVFAARYDGLHDTLYSIRPDGSGLTQLIDIPGATHVDPAALPKGDRIGFRSTMNDTRDLYILTLADSSITRVTFGMEARGAASWSPDGTKIAFAALAADDELDTHILDLATMEVTNLTNHPAADMTPAWSPVEPVIVFASDRDGTDQYEIDLYRHHLHTDGIARLTDAPGPETEPSWSPDGSTIAFTCPSLSGFMICVIDRGGANRRMLMEWESLEGGASPSWSPDGTRLVFWSNRGPYLVLYTMDTAGSQVTVLTDSTIDTPGSPIWISRE